MTSQRTEVVKASKGNSATKAMTLNHRHTLYAFVRNLELPGLVAITVLTILTVLAVS
jgi:hypothetical protein